MAASQARRRHHRRRPTDDAVTTPALAGLIATIASTRGDAARRKLELSLVKKLPKETIVNELTAAFEANQKARFIYPEILGVLHRRRIPTVKQAVRPLLLDKDRSVRANAARLVSEYGWGDDFIPELRRIVAREASQATSTALIPALEALGAARTDEAFEALLAAAKVPFKNPWRRGNLLMALAAKQRPEVRSLFEKVTRAKEHPYVRQGAAVGLARLGDRRALDRLRADFDSTDMRIGTSASIALKGIVGTPVAVSGAQLQRLARWWDAHPAEVVARFEKFIAARVAKRSAATR